VHISSVDKQFAAAVILIIFGFALTQMGGGEQAQSGADQSMPFLAGLGVGTVAIASFWIVMRIISDIKKNRAGR